MCFALYFDDVDVEMGVVLNRPGLGSLKTEQPLRTELQACFSLKGWHCIKDSFEIWKDTLWMVYK